MERATTFFMSDSKSALAPASSIVATPTGSRRFITTVLGNKGENRHRRYTPAVTSVEEWTKEDTGVGAAMAAGSHAEKGTWALFVNAAKASKAARPNSREAHDAPSRTKGPQDTEEEHRANLRRIKQSPTRLERAVISPALRDLFL